MAPNDTEKTKKKNAYPGQTDARRKASAKYLKESVEDIRIRVPKGRKGEIQGRAKAVGESLNQFVTKAVDERIERLQDKEKDGG